MNPGRDPTGGGLCYFQLGLEGLTRNERFEDLGEAFRRQQSLFDIADDKIVESAH
jgi:hypothetical protein